MKIIILKFRYLYVTALIGILLLALISCNDNNTRKTKWNYIDKPFETVIVMPEFEVAKSRLTNLNLLNKLGENGIIGDFKTTLNVLSKISLDGEALMAFSNQNNFEYLLIADTLDLRVNFASSDDALKDSLINFRQYNIKHSAIENTKFYSVLDNGFYLQTNNLELLQSILAKEKPSQYFDDLQPLTNTEKSLSVISKTDHLLNRLYTTEQTAKFADYFVLDIELEESQTLISGITQSMDSTFVLNSLKNITPCQLQFESILPNSINFGISICLSDELDFKNGPATAIKDSLPAFLNLAIEASLFNINEKSAIALRFPDKTIVSGEILSETIAETHRDIDIYNFLKPKIFEKFTEPFIKFSNANFVFEINNFYVFTENIEMAQDIITFYTSGKTIDQTKAHKEIEPNLSNQSSVLVFQNQLQLQQTLGNLFNLEKQPTLKNYELSAFQLIYEDNFAHINGIISQQNTRSAQNGIRELFNISLENDIVGNPQFFTNHLNNTKDVLVQDTGNTLYLISKDGKIYWKKRLDGLIQGDISELDIYRNGRIQMAFATDKTLYVLDRNGKDVDGFPKNFNDNITQPLSVFDYDNNGNYRLLITQNSNLLMFDKTGKMVTGFKPDLPNKTISTVPKHFRIGNKDYIVFAQENKLQILDRVGKTRIKADNDINFSVNDIYVNQNAFVTVTANGQLFKVNNKGISSFSDLKTLENTQITADQSTLVMFSGNELQINTIKKELDFGNYTAPRLFNFDGNIYISITDLQSKKGYLFDSKGNILSNFPIYASGPIQISRRTGKSIYVLTTTDSNSLIMYQL